LRSLEINENHGFSAAVDKVSEVNSVRFGRRQSVVMSSRTLNTYRNKQKNKRFINQYQVMKQLGYGAYAVVKLAKDKHTYEQFAVKIMNKDKLKKIKQGKDRNAYDCVKDELKVLERLDHPNVIFLREIIDDPHHPDIYLIMEYHSKGSLGDQLNQLNKNKKQSERSKGLDIYKLRLYLIDTLKALYYCHQVIKVIHRDIKPDNIMINHNQEAVLIDFGVSALVDD
jgi:serine/threonine protein kinase